MQSRSPARARPPAPGRSPPPTAPSSTALTLLQVRQCEAPPATTISCASLRASNGSDLTDASMHVVGVVGIRRRWVKPTFARPQDDHSPRHHHRWGRYGCLCTSSIARQLPQELFEDQASSSVEPAKSREAGTASLFAIDPQDRGDAVADHGNVVVEAAVGDRNHALAVADLSLLVDQPLPQSLSQAATSRWRLRLTMSFGSLASQVAARPSNGVLCTSSSARLTK